MVQRTSDYYAKIAKIQKKLKSLKDYSAYYSKARN